MVRRERFAYALNERYHHFMGITLALAHSIDAIRSFYVTGNSTIERRSVRDIVFNLEIHRIGRTMNI